MITLTIAGTDRTSFVATESLKIENILTKQVDKCRFIIRSYGSKNFKPVVGREVIILDGATRVFGGMIVRVEEKLSAYPLAEYEVQCSDYTRALDQHLVAETYENKTINEIIADLVANWCPTGFTATQVDAPVLVNYIQFKYEPVSDCLRQLAEIVGYDWYVDYSKDIYFKAPTATAAAVDIQDNNGTYDFGSLTIRRDSSQLRNSIIVRGGEYLGTEFTASMRADGKQVVFNLPYKYTDFKATLTGNPLNIGTDYINNADDYDALYNFNEKLLRFKDSDKPSQNATLSFAGKPHLPVIVKLKDQGKIDAIFSAEAQGDGIYEYLVVDKAINSKAGARQRALAEINSYGETLSEGEFNTEQSGLKAGQRIRINSTALGIDEYFIINRVTSVMKDYQTMYYRISLITTKTMDFIAVMKKLLLAETKKIEIKEGELLDLVEAADETITMAETFTASVLHNPQTEAISLADALTVQALDYDVDFVLGDETVVPSGTERVFIVSGSPMST